MHTVGVLCFTSGELTMEVRSASKEAGCPSYQASTAAELFAELKSARYSVALIELPVPETDARTLIGFITRLARPVLPIFLVKPGTAAAEVSDLIKAGAYYCLDAVAGQSEILGALSSARQEALSRALAANSVQAGGPTLLVGQSPAMQDLARIIQLVAKRRSTVLITGETGTGKEIAARAIHAASDRSHLPMVALNCSAIPENLLEAELFGHTKGAFTGAVGVRIGRFEQANNSTLFLDEIGDMPVELQAKLLRVLQEREIQRLGSSESIKLNVRMIAATNVNLMERVKQGSFREDLYYRLNVVPMAMPPLRERPGDIPLLARHFIERVCRAEGIPPKTVYQDTLHRLMRYAWPGNVRQLENAIEKAVVMSGDRELLLPADFSLPAELDDPQFLAPLPDRFSVPDHGIDFARTITVFERSILDEALRKTNGNRTLAAELLGMKRTTLISKLRALELAGA